MTDDETHVTKTGRARIGPPELEPEREPDLELEHKPFRASIQVDLEASDEQRAAEIAWELAVQIEQQPPVNGVTVESVW